MRLETTPREGGTTNKEKQMRSIVEKIDRVIREEGVDRDKIAEIAEELKRRPGIPAGDKLYEEAFSSYRQSLIEQELKKQNLN